VSAAAFVALAAGVAGCFTTAADFRNDAEDFIEQNEELRDALLDAPATFVSATCAEPANQDEGTTFACTGTDSNGEVWEFEVEIIGSNEYEVNLSRAPAGA
jgi:hypothetical protein